MSELIRGLDFRSATCVVMGAVIGSGIFLVASDVSAAVPTPGAAIAVWIAAGLISLLGGLTAAELGAMFPGSGGPYLYLREAFHPLPGFLYGWISSLIIQPGSIAAVAIAFAKFAGHIVALSPVGEKVVASLAITAFTLINLLGVRAGAGVLDGLTMLKVLALLAIAGMGLTTPAQQSLSAAGGAWPTASGFGVALIAAFWAYDGWINLPYVAGEVRDPQRNIPRALTLGICAVSALYVLVNVAIYLFVPVSEIVKSKFPAADAARAMGGAGAVQLVVWSVILSTLGCVNGMILGGARVTYAMAADGELPPWLARIHPTTRVPAGALIAQWAVALALGWSGTYEQLFTCVIALSFIFYGLGALALISLRNARPDLPRPYRVPLYPWLPIAYATFCFVFVANTVIEKPLESLAGLVILASGIPVYRYYRKR